VAVIVSWVEDWANLRRLLCIRLDNMGDILMTTPALRALRESGPPGRSLTLLASRSGSALASYLPDVDRVLALDAPWVKHERTHAGDLRSMVACLRRQRYDAAVIFTVYSQSPLPAAMLCHLAGIPRVLAHCRENPYHLLTHWVAETEPGAGIRHEVRRQLDLVAAVGARTGDLRLRFRTRPADRDTLQAKLRSLGVAAGRGWIVIHAGASAPSRRYPEEGFARVVSMLHAGGRPIVFTGGAGERETAARIIQRCSKSVCMGRPQLVDVAGVLSLGELACLVEAADLLISNNTGPVHLAAALQTPVVDLYALTNPQHTPWQVESRVLSRDVDCKYCYRSVCPQGHNACLTGIAPEEVVDAAHLLLESACTPLESMPPSMTAPPHWSQMAG
jgi:lipopolysaccharide heptosyltransferase II